MNCEHKKEIVTDYINDEYFEYCKACDIERMFEVDWKIPGEGAIAQMDKTGRILEVKLREDV